MWSVEREEYESWEWIQGVIRVIGRECDQGEKDDNRVKKSAKKSEL